MLIDFRSSTPGPSPVFIKGSEIERVRTYKYLGFTMDNTLTWHDHITIIVKKMNTRMYCLRKLNTFNVKNQILVMFYKSVLSSIWRSCLVCWGGNITEYDRRKINQVIKEAGRIVGELLHDVDTVYKKEVGSKYNDIMADNSHPLHGVLESAIIPRSGRMRIPYAATNRHPSSFIPRAIKFHNNSFNR